MAEIKVDYDRQQEGDWLKHKLTKMSSSMSLTETHVDYDRHHGDWLKNDWIMTGSRIVIGGNNSRV